jgi:hypothetical protein
MTKENKLKIPLQLLQKIPPLQKLQNILTKPMMTWETGHSVLPGTIKEKQQV